MARVDSHCPSFYKTKTNPLPGTLARQDSTYRGDEKPQGDGSRGRPSAVCLYRGPDMDAALHTVLSVSSPDKEANCVK